MVTWVCEHDGNVSIGLHGFAARASGSSLRPRMGARRSDHDYRERPDPRTRVHPAARGYGSRVVAHRALRDLWPDACSAPRAPCARVGPGERRGPMTRHRRGGRVIVRQTPRTRVSGGVVPATSDEELARIIYAGGGRVSESGRHRFRGRRRRDRRGACDERADVPRRRTDTATTAAFLVVREKSHRPPQCVPNGLDWHLSTAMDAATNRRPAMQTTITIYTDCTRCNGIPRRLQDPRSRRGRKVPALATAGSARPSRSRRRGSASIACRGRRLSARQHGRLSRHRGAADAMRRAAQCRPGASTTTSRATSWQRPRRALLPLRRGQCGARLSPRSWRKSRALSATARRAQALALRTAMSRATGIPVDAGGRIGRAAPEVRAAACEVETYRRKTGRSRGCDPR